MSNRLLCFLSQLTHVCTPAFAQLSCASPVGHEHVEGPADPFLSFRLSPARLPPARLASLLPPGFHSAAQHQWRPSEGDETGLRAAEPVGHLGGYDSQDDHDDLLDLDVGAGTVDVGRGVPRPQGHRSTKEWDGSPGSRDAWVAVQVAGLQKRERQQRQGRAVEVEGDSDVSRHLRGQPPRYADQGRSHEQGKRRMGHEGDGDAGVAHGERHTSRRRSRSPWRELAEPPPAPRLLSPARGALAAAQEPRRGRRDGSRRSSRDGRRRPSGGDQGGRQQHGADYQAAASENVAQRQAELDGLGENVARRAARGRQQPSGRRAVWVEGFITAEHSTASGSGRTGAAAGARGAVKGGDGTRDAQGWVSDGADQDRSSGAAPQPQAGYRRGAKLEGVALRFVRPWTSGSSPGGGAGDGHEGQGNTAAMRSPLGRMPQAFVHAEVLRIRHPPYAPSPPGAPAEDDDDNDDGMFGAELSARRHRPLSQGQGASPPGRLSMVPGLLEVSCREIAESQVHSLQKTVNCLGGSLKPKQTVFEA